MKLAHPRSYQLEMIPASSQDSSSRVEEREISGCWGRSPVWSAKASTSISFQLVMILGHRRRFLLLLSWPIRALTAGNGGRWSTPSRPMGKPWKTKLAINTWRVRNSHSFLKRPRNGDTRIKGFSRVARTKIGRVRLLLRLSTYQRKAPRSRCPNWALQ